MSINQLIKNIRKLECSYNNPVTFHFENTVSAEKISTKMCKASALHSKNCFSNSCWCTTTARAVSYPQKKTATQSCVTAFLLYYDYSFFKHLKNSRQALVKPAILLQDVYYVYSDFLNNHMHADRNK